MMPHGTALAKEWWQPGIMEVCASLMVILLNILAPAKIATLVKCLGSKVQKMQKLLVL